MGDGEFRPKVVTETTRRAKRNHAVPEPGLTRGHFSATKRRMSLIAQPCPFLPEPRPGLDWRALHSYRNGERGPAFYRACLEYGHALWLQGYAARTLLCLDRALGADVSADDPVLRSFPLPYAAMAWCIAHTPPERAVGNPRVHFQHYADRMNEPRRDQRRWRAWACWALTRAVRPDLPADPKHGVEEPTLAQIAAGLTTSGHPGEADLWSAALRNAALAANVRHGHAD